MAGRMRPLAIGAALLLAAGAARAAPACPPERVEEAFLLAFPVGELVRTRAAALARADAAGAMPLNRFRHRRQLSTPADRGVTAPNVDTLCSAAWFDLAAGPLVLDLPAAAGRYVSVAIMDMAGDHVAPLHPAPDRPRRIALAAAGTRPGGADRLVLPVRRGWMIARVFVAGPEDLAAAQAVQVAIRLSGPAPAPPAAPAGSDTPAELLATVNAELAAGPPPQALAGSLERLACTGLGADAPTWDELSEAIRARWTDAMPRLLAELRQGFATEREPGGWRGVHPATGTADAPDRVRAGIALSGLGALPAAEAAYFRTDEDRLGQPLDGSRTYRIRLPAAMPRAAFWSLTLYERTPDGRLFLVPNTPGRHAINSTSRGLRPDPDGAIPIRTGPLPPAGDEGLWLPSTAGPISLVFRIYRPDPKTRFVPPPVDPDPPALPAQRP